MIKFLTFLLILIVVNSFPSLASAHVLETNGSVGAVVHIDPDDDPIANQPAAFYFEFKDKENKFQPSNCLCQVKIEQAGKIIYQQDLFSNNPNPSLSNASFQFTFPGKDVYKVIVEGKPNVENAFTPFTLSYDIRVARDQGSPTTETNKTTPNAFPWLIISGVVILGIGAGLFFKYRKKS